MPTTRDFASLPGPLQSAIRQRSRAARMRSLEVNKVEREIAMLTDRLGSLYDSQNAALTGLRIHLGRAGFGPGDEVEIDGEIYFVGEASAHYVGCALPDGEPEEWTAADQRAEDRATYRDATRVS
jgi:hypothetical protein